MAGPGAMQQAGAPRLHIQRILSMFSFLSSLCNFPAFQSDLAAESAVNI